MVKFIFLVTVFSALLFAENLVEKNCISCHKKEQIPSYMIYKRYLLKYSVNDRIADAIYKYLKNPKKENSIMPKPFFLKFPMKKPLDLNDAQLRLSVTEFVKKFDVKKRLRLEKAK